MKRKRDSIDHLKVPASPPVWSDYFEKNDSKKLKAILRLKTKKSLNRMKMALPISADRYVRTRSREVGTSLTDRRRKLVRIKSLAIGLRKCLLELNGLARLDLLAAATTLTGSTFDVDADNPHSWLIGRAGPVVRDLSVSSSKASNQLKKFSIRGGRPKHVAERILVWDLAVLYRSCTNRIPGRRGYFPKFVQWVFQRVDPHGDNSGLDDLVREIVKEFKAELDENS